MFAVDKFVEFRSTTDNNFDNLRFALEFSWSVRSAAGELGINFDNEED